MERRAPVKRKKHSDSPASLITTVVFIAFIVVGVLCYTRWVDIQERKARLVEENRQLIAQRDALEDRNNALLAQGARGNDDAYVERVAREQLDMVYPGEIVFKVTGE
jgi:Septum formation initiator.